MIHDDVVNLVEIDDFSPGLPHIPWQTEQNVSINNIFFLPERDKNYKKNPSL
jgi:hypothetical protein